MKRFSLFLITSLSLTAFLVGYLLMEEGFDPRSKSKTGTILEKFEDETDNNSGLVTENGSSTHFLITDRKVISPTSSTDNNSILYYERGSGRLFEFDLSQKTERTISDAPLPNFISGIWSPSKKEVIQSFYSRSGQDFKHYSLANNQMTKLDSNIRSVAFSFDGNAIAYYYRENDINQPGSSSGSTLNEAGLPTVNISKIVIAQPNGQYPKKILDTRIEDLEITWPAKDQIVLRTPSSGIYILTEGGKLNKFMDSVSLFEEKWSQGGKKLLFSALTDESGEPVLGIKNVETREEQMLNIGGNANKCAWSIDDVTVICALAKSPSVDELYQINTVTGSKQLIAEPKLPIKEVMLSRSENYLLFISSLDDKLYGVDISD